MAVLILLWPYNIKGWVSVSTGSHPYRLGWCNVTALKPTVSWEWHPARPAGCHCYFVSLIVALICFWIALLANFNRIIRSHSRILFNLSEFIKRRMENNKLRERILVSVSPVTPVYPTIHKKILFSARITWWMHYRSRTYFIIHWI